MAADMLTTMLSCGYHQPIPMDSTPLIDSIDSYELIGRFGFINSLFILCFYLPNKWSTFFIRPTHPPDIL
eukprot:scaffold6228_cov144-Skeletonema_dohrnii-CCMP3373.AAC.9